MDNFTATEQAYKNGYEQGKAEASEMWKAKCADLELKLTDLCELNGRRERELDRMKAQLEIVHLIFGGR